MEWGYWPWALQPFPSSFHVWWWALPSCAWRKPVLTGCQAAPCTLGDRLHDGERSPYVYMDCSCCVPGEWVNMWIMYSDSLSSSHCGISHVASWTIYEPFCPYQKVTLTCLELVPLVFFCMILDIYKGHVLYNSYTFLLHFTCVLYCFVCFVPILYAIHCPPPLLEHKLC